MPTTITAYAFDLGTTVVGTPKNSVDAIIDLKAEINSITNHENWTDIPATNLQVSYPGVGDESYESGKIQLYEMFKGRYEANLTDTFNNFQYGSVKNFSEDGGTVENTITNVSSSNPAVITTGENLKLRLPHTVTFPLNTSRYNGQYEFSDLDVTTSLNGNKYYVKPTSATTAELYTDSDLTTGVDGATLGTTGAQGAGTIKGFAGSRIRWSFYAKTRTALHEDVKLMVTINWKEIIQ